MMAPVFSSLVRVGRALLAYGLERDTLVRSLKTALLVGSILGLINHGPTLLAGHFTSDQLAPLFITYLVPLCAAA